MIDTATTTTILLDGLADAANEAAWRELDRRYRPIIEASARKLGLSEEEAADAAQDTLIRFLKAYRDGKYDRTRGRLRSWIIGILKYRVADARQAKAARPAHRGESALLQLPSDDRLEQIWEEERQRAVLSAALSELRATSRTHDKTIEAFEMLVWKELPAPEVASRLGMDVHDVYMAKRRMTERLREIVARLESVYVEEA